MGRPETVINWEKVIQLKKQGYFSMDIADYLGISRQLLFTRCIKDKGCLYRQL